MNVRVDLGKDYHTQRNNKTRPGITCASTSMAMALIYSGYEKELEDFSKDSQQEDFITNFIHTDPRVIEFWKNNPQRWISDGWIQYQDFLNKKRSEKETMFGNEIHEVLQFAINTLFPGVDRLSYAMPIKEILFNLLKGGAVVTSGKWPHKDLGSIAHVVCLTGFVTEQENMLLVNSPEEIDVSKITGFNIDDPYGDYHTKYKSDKGDNVVMSRSDFFAILNEPGCFTAKRAHLIKPKV